MNGRDILISGASIAGPALAWWLSRFGFNPTVVERAPSLRPGGQAVDFRGPAHMSVLTRMGVLDEIRRRQTDMGPVSFVDAAGKARVSMSAEFAAGEVEILRGDLSEVLFEATRHTTEYIFGDTITALQEVEDGVEVAFAHAAPRRFDLVVGADGLHSNVRRLTFGDEARFVRHTGYHVAIFQAPNTLGLDRAGQIHCAPGRAVGLYGQDPDGPARAVFYFVTPGGDHGRRDIAEQKRLLAETFAGVGWEAPRLLEAMWEAPDFYLDAIGKVEMDRWSQGRVVLLGDAGYGGTIGGMGTGLAVVCAYVLAGELADCGGDHGAAFGRYAAKVGAYARMCQKGADGVGPFMAPRSHTQIWLRDLMLAVLDRMPGKG